MPLVVLAGLGDRCDRDSCTHAHAQAQAQTLTQTPTQAQAQAQAPAHGRLLSDSRRMQWQWPVRLAGSTVMITMAGRIRGRIRAKRATGRLALVLVELLCLHLQTGSMYRLARPALLTMP